MKAIPVSKPQSAADIAEIAQLEVDLKSMQIKLYGLHDDQKVDKRQIAEISQKINRQAKMSGGICAKNLDVGDVAWCCMDCEKDPTCIICKSCFEKSDHKGHRVMLNRNVSGCCDCGDPEAWDPNHFCSDHAGYEKSPDEILKKIPASIRDGAFVVFKEICAKIRKNCLSLQELKENGKVAMQPPDSDQNEQIKQTKIQQIHLLLKFLNDRVSEVPAFLYIIDQKINEIIPEQKQFAKHECCTKGFVTPDPAQQDEEQNFDGDLCSCSVLDILLQSINIITNKARKMLHDLALNLFQSYNFKQQLTLSYAANYAAIHRDRVMGDEQYHITSLSVQVLTSSELAMLIYKNENLLYHMLAVFDDKMSQYILKPTNEEKLYRDLNFMIHDLDYIGRKDCLKYCIAKTNLIPKMIWTVSKLYTFDSKSQRSTMVENAEDGSFHEGLVRMELSLINILNIYLQEVRHDDLKSNMAILEAFVQVFDKTQGQIKETDGIYCLPIHRCFAYFFTRLILYNYYDPNQFVEEKQKQISPQQLFRIIFKKNLPDQNQTKLDEILQSILKLQIQQLSFVHEISSKKWIYHGDYLEQYPDLYHKAQDLQYFQDFTNFQIILGVSEGSNLIEYFINNFGLDDELQTLINGIKNKEVSKAHFDKFAKFDEQKLRMQLTLFLRFIVHLCVYEISFLKQIYNPIEEGEPDPNMPAIKNLWKQALRKEAVHLLMLNKVNVNIQTLKDNMIEILEDDPMFEETLFEMSEQSRDIKNQVTFRLKEEFHGVFDPFYYVLPEQHSQIYQMYDQNNFKNKSVETGLNDIIGDYLGNSSQFESGLNLLIVQNLAQSSILDVIFPLFENWLKFRKADKIQKQADFLNQFMDQSVHSTCLKLIVLILNSGKVEILAQKLNQELIAQIQSWKKETDIDVKTKNILVFILKKFKSIKPEFFDDEPMDEAIEIIDPKMENSKTENTKKTPDDKLKSKLKKRQEKLLDKMKKGGTKYLTENKKLNAEEPKDGECSMQCAFCQEDLENEKFIQNPFGNFIYCQSNNLLYRSIINTLKNQNKAFQNERNPGSFVKEDDENQIIENDENDEEEQKESEIVIMDRVANVPGITNDEQIAIQKFNDKIEAKSKLSKPELVKTICNLNEKNDAFSSFLNQYTGSGSVITMCKHYSHLECLRKYHLQQIGLGDDDEQRKVNAFSYGEFACPVCKQIKNGILPSFPLSQIVAEQQLGEADLNKLLDFYVDVFSQLLQSQIGLTVGPETQQLVLKDIENKPELIISGVLNHIIHRIYLIDIKGMKDYIDNETASTLRHLYGSLLSIIKITSPNQPFFQESAISLEKEENSNLLDLNICLILMKSLLKTSNNSENIKKLILHYYPYLKIQFLYAVFWRKNKGIINSAPFQSLSDLYNFETEISKEEYLKDMLLQIEIHSMRKIFVTVTLLRPNEDSNQEILQKASSQLSDIDEMKIIKEYLGLEKDQLEELMKNNEDQHYSKYFIERQINRFSGKITQNCEMPDNLKLMTTLYEFSLFELPSVFLDVQRIYYKKKCRYCSTEPKDCAICLLCGQTMCYVDDAMDQYCIVFDFENVQDQGEGVLSYHTRVHEGSCGIFLHLSTGNIVMIQNGSSAQQDSPYRNKYGEVVNPRDKRWHSFKIDKLGGGTEALNALKKLYMDFKMSNMILSVRNNPDAPFDLFERNDL